MKTLSFIKQFMKNPSQTGALNPSSPHLARKMVETACIKPDATVVEFGPGTGIFTEHIAQDLSPDNTFFAIEINERFVHATRKRCPQVTVIHDSASNTRHHLTQQGRPHCDRIISGLPWAVFPTDLQDTLLDTIQDVLCPGGRFVTFAYVQGLMLPAGKAFKRKLKSRFAHMGRSPVVWRNLPPALIYWAEV